MFTSKIVISPGIAKAQDEALPRLELIQNINKHMYFPEEQGLMDLRAEIHPSDEGIFEKDKTRVGDGYLELLWKSSKDSDFRLHVPDNYEGGKRQKAIKALEGFREDATPALHRFLIPTPFTDEQVPDIKKKDGKFHINRKLPEQEEGWHYI